MIKVYTYQKCGTCRKATKWLNDNCIDFEEHAIRETPPTLDELKTMLTSYNGDLKRLFNTSGMDYRSLKIKDRLPGMSETEALELLHSNGNLVKRPFLLSKKWNTVGFKLEDWQAHLS